MKKTILVIGLGRYGLNLVESLSHTSVEVVAIDLKAEAVGKATEFIQYAYVCDSTNESALGEIGVKNVDLAMVAIGQDNSSNVVATIMTVIVLKRLGVKNISVRVDDDNYKSVFLSVGATEMISPLKIAAERIANRHALNNVVDYFHVTGDFDIFEIEVGADFNEVGLIDLNARSVYGANIILIKRAGMIFTPFGSDSVKPQDIVFAFGKKREIMEFTAFLDGKTK